MALSQSIIHYLRKSRIGYDVINVTPFESIRGAANAAGIPVGSLALGILMTDHMGPVMVVVPGSDEADLAGINALLGREVRPATQWQITKIFNDCDSRFLPALGDAYGVRTLIDERVIAQGQQHIHLFAGDVDHLLCFNRQAFFNLQSKAWFAQGLAKPAAGPRRDDDLQGTPAARGADRIKDRMAGLASLPMMPGIAHEVIKLRSNPTASAQDLARLVQLDPSLAAQVIRYANAPFFGYRGRVDSVQTAISRVLGYEMVMNLAMGIAAAKPFKMPRQGALGLLAFWRHAIYSAATMQVLSRELGDAVSINAGMSYLAGLLHNFGLLLLGHLFKAEYQELCALAAAQPHRPLIELEQQVLGVGHGELGGGLLAAWGLPQEVVITAREHHNVAYSGVHAEYVGLTLLTDRILKNHGIGDAADITLPPPVLAALGLDEVKALSVMNRILQGCAGLDTMARQLAA